MHPTLLQAGPLTVGTHDAFAILALAVGLAIYYRALGKRGMLEERIILVSAAVVLGGTIGARTITAWENTDEIGRALAGGAPLSWVILHGNKSILGGIAGGFLAGVLAKRALGYRRSTGDSYALAIAVATAIGRVGCFLSELPLGTPTTLPWGMTVDADAAAAFPRCPGCGGPMHPSMLYEVGFNVVAAVLIVRLGRRVPVQGDLLKLYLLAAFVFRFAVEFVRGNEIQLLGLTGPQVVLIPLIAWLAIHFARRYRARSWRLPPAPAPA
ncbi:MAG TPA: prolipoprotein diacylglyceryl transferase family protein [Candidatus Limnocylindrales bacterium]|nr:prolipoprotein diacylglyceryl transferase family protein [Candidatus Limnocylindrales bacterium]